jgi:hypothetical protein
MNKVLHPKTLVLIAAVLSAMTSVILWFGKDDQLGAIFVGLWVPSLLSLGNMMFSPEGERSDDDE